MPEMKDNPGELFRAGRLGAAVEAANQAVRKAPGDLGARVLLAELLLFSGNLQRADTILDAAAQADPAAAVVVAEFRQLLRADTARRQLRSDGRVPEFLDQPGPGLQAALQAWVALRGGDGEAAARHAREAEQQRPRAAGRSGDADFDDFRDADDLSAGYFEVLTTTGKYYWIPTERVASVEFHPPKRPRDLMWRRASMSVHNGPDGDVYVPVIYAGDTGEAADEIRLGRATDWVEQTGGLVIGRGQRTFLAGEQALGIMELTSLSFGS
jgi:type VI secretion system protein ImpE